jgi:hypothetical protein
MADIRRATTDDLPVLCALLGHLFAQEAEFTPDAEAQIARAAPHHRIAGWWRHPRAVRARRPDRHGQPALPDEHRAGQQGRAARRHDHRARPSRRRSRQPAARRCDCARAHSGLPPHHAAHRSATTPSASASTGVMASSMLADALPCSTELDGEHIARASGARATRVWIATGRSGRGSWAAVPLLVQVFPLERSCPHFMPMSPTSSRQRRRHDRVRGRCAAARAHRTHG